MTMAGLMAPLGVFLLASLVAYSLFRLRHPSSAAYSVEELRSELSARISTSSTPGDFTGRATPVAGLSAVATCGRYVLFTSQRSGSTWTCQVLDSQPGVTCGVVSNGRGFPEAEMMIRYSPSVLLKSNRSHLDISWEDWKRDAEHAFDRLQVSCKAQKGQHGMVGFKLMYNQVPIRFIDKFLEWLQQQNIMVVQLVREATILRIASQHQTSVSHTTNATLAAMLQKGAKAGKLLASTLRKRPEQVAAQCKRLEALNTWWQQTLSFGPNISHHYVSYEQLVGPVRDFHLKAIIYSLGTFLVPGSPFAQVEKSLVQLHESTCESRVANYSALAELLQGSRTAAACALLSGNHLVAPRHGLPDYVHGAICDIC